MVEFQFDFEFTLDKFKKCLPDYTGNIEELYTIFHDVLRAYRVTSPHRLAGFIDQFNYRTKGFTDLETLRPNPVTLRQWATFIKVTPEEANKYLTTLKGTIDLAGWIWNINYLNTVADNQDQRNLAKRINPELTDLQERHNNFQRIYHILNG